MSAPRTDAEAWNAALAGDGAAFAEIFDRYQHRILQHARRLVPSPEDAKDVVGITFLEAWRKRDSVRFVNDSLLAWLLVTATHTARNMTRAARRHQRALERIPPSPDAPDPADIIGGGPAVQLLRTLSRRHQDVVAREWHDESDVSRGRVAPPPNSAKRRNRSGGHPTSASSTNSPTC